MENSNMSESSSAAQVPDTIEPGADRRGNLTDRHYSMYRACTQGDCIAAEMLIEGDPNLCTDEISEAGDRALHVAASMNHQQLVQKLLQRMSPSELVLLDGQGYTACCYAAISGAVDIADLMVKMNPSLATARDQENKTPIQKAASQGNGKMVLYFLKSIKAEDLSTQEWFDLLLLTIRRRTYGAALKILGINEELAIMTNDEGTALHLLAKQRFYLRSRQYFRGVMQREMGLLAEKLLACIQRLLGQSDALVLMKEPSILHDAAKEGNIELITMLTREYPHLIWLTDDKGYTIFHIAVIYRHAKLFGLINELGARKDLITVTQDENGNNILHLVGELPHPTRMATWLPALQMQMELLWYMKVRETVTPVCREMKNKDGETPLELFLEGHKNLTKESYTWMESVSDSCKLIATLIFAVVFGFAFSVPGGYDQVTGVPVLLGKTWFTIFVIFDGLAMFSSGFSIACFLIINMNGMHESHFVKRIPTWFVWGLAALSVSVLAAVSAFVSAFFLIYSHKRSKPVPVLILFLIMVGYAIIAYVVSVYTFLLFITLPKWKHRWRTRHSLFKGPDVALTRRR